VLSDVGPFGGLFQLQGYREPVLVSSTDSVGSKVHIALGMRHLCTLGVDLVNHCVNDIFVAGAEPLFFLDYLGLGKLVPEETAELVAGVAEACKANGCALIGGETAELPGLYRPGEFDLAGFIVGGVERSEIIDGSAIRKGDVVLGLPSSGLHTNGYSLVRKIFDTDANPDNLQVTYAELARPLGDALLEPHRTYYPVLKQALPYIRGMAHITGGGLPGNVPRVLPEDLAVRIDRSAWQAPPIFNLIQETGNVLDDEMFRVFNMGIGLVVMAAGTDVEKIITVAPDAVIIGEVVEHKAEARVLLE
jgi:phosphoribosylformylglycinamidine cyclo-ligase